MDLVSVIIPYYKKRNFIKETITSVINQSYDHLEILIIYDDTNLNDLAKGIPWTGLKIQQKINNFQTSQTLNCVFAQSRALFSFHHLRTEMYPK